MTAPSDFLDLDLHRFDDDGGANHSRIEEHWDEPACCDGCGTVPEDGVLLTYLSWPRRVACRDCRTCLNATSLRTRHSPPRAS